MQHYSELDQLSRERASTAIIKQAIHDRACLSGTHVEFRVRFAPHVLGRDENGRHIVFAFEYGGLTLGRAHWMCFAVHRLRGLQRTGDPWRSGSLKSRPQFDLTEIEAAVNDNSSKLPAVDGERNAKVVMALRSLWHPPRATLDRLPAGKPAS